MNNRDFFDLFESEFRNLSWEECLEKINKMYSIKVKNIFTYEDITDFIKQYDEAEISKIKILRRLSEECFYDNVELAKEYAIKLLMKSMLKEDDELASTVEKLRIISEERFPYSVDLAKIYAQGIAFLLRKQSPDKQVNAIKILKKLSEERFVNNAEIMDYYNKSVEYLKNMHVTDVEHDKDMLCLSVEQMEEVLTKIESLLKEAKIEDVYDNSNAIRAFQLLRILYANNELHVSCDKEFEAVFKVICEFYDVLNLNKEKIAFLPIRSNRGRIFTLHPESCDFYAIVWDSEYWEFFQFFCSILLEFIKQEQNSLNDVIVGQILGQKYEHIILNTLIYRTYIFLSNRYCKTNPDLSLYFKSAIERYRKKSEIKYTADSDENMHALVYLGKLYVMFHEMEHIFEDLDSQITSEDFEEFKRLLFVYWLFVKENTNESIHDYSKEEYLDRLGKLIDGKNEWENLCSELFNDIKAFYEMLVFQEYLCNKQMMQRIKDSLIGSKVYNMFRTYLYLVSYFAEKSMEYKKRGMKGIECIHAIKKELHQAVDEVEYRQVLNQYIQLFYLVQFKENGILSDEEYNQIQLCTEPYIDAYQNYIRIANIVMQNEIINELIELS